MRVTLIRHGEAGDDAPRDAERALTKRGRADARRVGRALGRRGVRFSAAISSPFVRAVQTAEIVVASLGQRELRVTISDVLVPEGSPRAVVGMLSSLSEADARSVALVAHEPILSGLAAALLGVREFRSLRKGEALRIRLDRGTEHEGKLRWRIDPDTGRRERL
jgi:phosphohistidine phosphatase